MPAPTGDLTVAETLARCTACVGCVMAPFETVDEIALIYGLDRDQLLDELRAAAQPDQDRRPT